MGEIVNNVSDRRQQWIGSWEVAPGGLIYDGLTPEHSGQEVVYRDASGNAEVGTISSWKNGLVFVRFTTGDTAAACHPSSLSLVLGKVGYHADGQYSDEGR